MKFIFNYDCMMSVNQMYYIRKHQNGKQLTTEAKNLRARIINDTINQMDVREIDKEQKLRIDIFFYGNWYYQNGNLRKKDLDNQLKFLLDSIFLALDLDDKLVFYLTAEKIQNKWQEKCEVIINKYGI